MEHADTPSEILTANEVAALLKLHLKTIYKLAESGKIPAKQIGHSWRFRRSQILAYMGDTTNGK